MKKITKLLATLLVVLLSVCTVCSSVLAETAELEELATETTNTTQNDHEITVEVVGDEDEVADVVIENGTPADPAYDNNGTWWDASDDTFKVDVPDVELTIDPELGYEIADDGVTAKEVEALQKIVKDGFSMPGHWEGYGWGAHYVEGPFIQTGSHLEDDGTAEKAIEVVSGEDGTWIVKAPTITYTARFKAPFSWELVPNVAVDDPTALDAYDIIYINIETGEISFRPTNEDGSLALENASIELAVDPDEGKSEEVVIFDANNLENFVENYSGFGGAYNTFAGEGLTFSNIKVKAFVLDDKGDYVYDDEGKAVLADKEIFTVNNEDGVVSVVAEEEGHFEVLLEGRYTETTWEWNYAPQMGYGYGMGFGYGMGYGYGMPTLTKKTHSAWATFARIEVTAYEAVNQGIVDEDGNLIGDEWLVAKEKEFEEGYVPEEGDDIYEIKAIAGEKETLAYFDIDLYEQEAGHPAEKVSTDDNEVAPQTITLKVKIAKEDYEADKNLALNVYYRHGDNDAKKIDGVKYEVTPVKADDGTVLYYEVEVTFLANQFSTYAVGYSFYKNAVAAPAEVRAIPNTATR